MNTLDLAEIHAAALGIPEGQRPNVLTPRGFEAVDSIEPLRARRPPRPPRLKTVRS